MIPRKVSDLGTLTEFYNIQQTFFTINVPWSISLSVSTFISKKSNCPLSSYKQYIRFIMLIYCIWQHLFKDQTLLPRTPFFVNERLKRSPPKSTCIHKLHNMCLCKWKEENLTCSNRFFLIWSAIISIFSDMLPVYSITSFFLEPHIHVMNNCNTKRNISSIRMLQAMVNNKRPTATLSLSLFFITCLKTSLGAHLLFSKESLYIN
jgi:hypothetical protein